MKNSINKTFSSEHVKAYLLYDRHADIFQNMTGKTQEIDWDECKKFCYTVRGYSKKRFKEYICQLYQVPQEVFNEMHKHPNLVL